VQKYTIGVEKFVFSEDCVSLYFMTRLNCERWIVSILGYLKTGKNQISVSITRMSWRFWTKLFVYDPFVWLTANFACILSGTVHRYAAIRSFGDDIVRMFLLSIPFWTLLLSQGKNYSQNICVFIENVWYFIVLSICTIPTFYERV
jgi:hypothetical protein